MITITEQCSNHDNLEKLSVQELLVKINDEDQTVAAAVALVLPQLTTFVIALSDRMQRGGRLFYIGAGTSGRLGILDASECPPTFGVPHDLVVGIIAGGDSAIRKAVEFAEDDAEQAWTTLREHQVSPLDTLVGIAASGTTPYVIGGITQAREAGLLTACITCNTGSPLAKAAEHSIEIVVGPEFITGSTRMKSGTAQKLVLNMISTAAMIQMGRVEGNRMVDMKLSNKKLVNRGIKMIMESLKVTAEEANTLLKKYGSVRDALLNYRNHGK